MVVSYEVRKEAYTKYIDYMKNRLSLDEFKYSFEEFNQIKEVFMDVICLHFVYNMTFRKIAEIYGFSKSYAQAIIYHAYRSMRKGSL